VASNTSVGRAAIVRDAQAGVPNYSPWIECCFDGNPRTAIQRTLRARHTMHGYPADYEHTLRIVRSATSTARRLPPRVDLQQRVANTTMPLSGNMTLVLTTDGFINLDQACEYRLRYVDPSATDAIWGVDVLLSNGTSHLVQQNDPGFEQLIDIFEDQGYTISTGDRR
jgi:hypothetical protein